MRHGIECENSKAEKPDEIDLRQRRARDERKEKPKTFLRFFFISILLLFYDDGDGSGATDAAEYSTLTHFDINSRQNTKGEQNRQKQQQKMTTKTVKRCDDCGRCATE